MDEFLSVDIMDDHLKKPLSELSTTTKFGSIAQAIEQIAQIVQADVANKPVSRKEGYKAPFPVPHIG